MPAGQGKDAERFDAAVESGTPPGAAGDADLARELEIVAMLRSRGAAFAPDAETKARAKQRLMAVLANEHAGPRQAPRPAVAPPTAAEMTAPLGRLVEREDVDPTAETTRMAPVTAAGPAGRGTDDAETRTDDATAVEPIPLHGGRARRRARHSIATRTGRARSAGAGLRRRVVLVGSAAAAAVLALASGGVLASGGALPGDTLYPVKRVAESAGLALTFDDASRARRHLEIAATRLAEVEQLAARDAQAEPAPEVYTAAMDDFDAATDEGSRLLLAAAESGESGTAADDLHTWAAEQSERLTELEPELPAAADADTSIALLERLLGRTESLDPDAACDEDDCASGRTGDETSPESGAPEASEDVTSTPDEDSSADPSETDEPSRTPTETSERENPRLLPDLAPDGNREDQDRSAESRSEEDEDGTSTSEPESGDEGGEGGNVSVPLPLLPPVTLPPLLPGMPGITIG